MDGLPQLLVIPLVPLLMKRIDARLIVGAGLFVFAASCFMNLHLDLDYAAPQLLWPDVTRELGQALILAPLSARTLNGTRQAERDPDPMYVIGAYMFVARVVRTGRVPLDETPAPPPAPQ
jgi:hypothetical protein